MDIYIKPLKKIDVIGKKEVLLKDAAEVVAPPDKIKKIESLRLLKISAEEKRKNYLISCTDIIKAITRAFPDAAVENVGEPDTVVQYAAEKKKENAALLWIKVAFVVLVLIIGSATAVMSFHTDAQVPKVFENYYKIFYGEEKSNPLIINIPYSVGLAVGIIVFYNHFMGKKLTEDPTPIEVEMSLYETDVTDTVLETLNKKKNQNEPA